VLCPRLAIYAILVIVVTFVLGVIYILSGCDPSVMIINMTMALSALMAIIAVIEVLKRKVKIND
jgi:hypothetical protein